MAALYCARAPTNSVRHSYTCNTMYRTADTAMMLTCSLGVRTQPISRYLRELGDKSARAIIQQLSAEN
jgi:hypothetical protein